MEKIKIPNSKDRNIAAVIHYPAKQTEKLAILCPGYLDSKDYDHMIHLASDLALNGYTAVRFDPTGVWESEGDISEYTTTQYLADIKSVLEYMLTKHKYNHILIGGRSRGGKVAVLYATRDPRVSAVVSIMPSLHSVIDHRREEAQKNGFTLSKRDTPDKSGMKEFKVPYSHILDNDKYDVLGDVRKVQSPIIFVAAELDDMCLPEDVKRIYDNANEPKKFILISGIIHDYRYNLSDVKLVNDKIIAELNNLEIKN